MEGNAFFAPKQITLFGKDPAQISGWQSAKPMDQRQEVGYHHPPTRVNILITHLAFGNVYVPNRFAMHQKRISHNGDPFGS